MEVTESAPVGSKLQGDVASQRDAPHAPGPKERLPGLGRHSALLAIGLFVTTFVTHSRMAKLPLRSLIRERLHLGPEAAADLFALASIAWYLKPLAGALSDTTPLLGSRRRAYVVLSGGLGAALWGVTAVSSDCYAALVVAVVCLNAATALGSTALGGILVEQGDAHDAMGRLTALRMSVTNCAVLLAGPLGGWLAMRAFRWTCLGGALLMLALAVAALLLLRPVPRATPGGARVKGGVMLATILRSGTLWSAAAMSFAFYVMPGVQNVLYYYQHDALHLSDQQIGILAGVNGGFGLLAVACYGYVCRRIRPRTLLALGILFYTASSLMYLGYRSWPTAFAVEAANGFIGVLGLLPIQELAARGTPRGSEALGFAVILGIGNLGVELSEVLGTRIASGLDLSFAGLVWVSAATSAITLVGVPLLPRALLERREG